MAENDKSVKEERIRRITKLYYSNPKLQEYMIEFSKNREVVPRYFEGFGKRPDMIQYPSDVIGLVQKGATSFHCSEELWNDPLQLQSSMSPREVADLRKSWDLLIDIDSPYLDFSKIACVLVCNALEDHGVFDYGIKFSGSKGFHIIVSGEAFPDEFEDMIMKESFPQWPRAIVGYLIENIRADYNKKIVSLGLNLEALKQRTKLDEKDITEFLCPNCSQPVEQTNKVTLKCEDCGATVERPNMKVTNRVMRCTSCPGKFDVIKEEPFFVCQHCGAKSVDFQNESGGGRVVFSKAAREQSRNYATNFEKTYSGQKVGGFDLVLVAPRHLFRMPYSLHEKTTLASVVINKKDVENFTPIMAQPLKVELKPFLKKTSKGCGRELLRRALEWSGKREENEKRMFEAKVEKVKKEYVQKDYSFLTEKDFPDPIKKLLKGLEDGKKRGLFILLSFLRSIGYKKDQTDVLARQWNERNQEPLKEGYIRSQVEWQYRQRKPIMPPNYSNDAFYKDLGLLDKKPKSKNPLADVAFKMRDRT